MKEATEGPGARLEELESRLAFQDDLIESLNQVVARQDQELIGLRRRLEALERKMQELAEAAAAPGSTTGHDIPPHY